MKRTVLTFLLFLTVITISSCGGGGDGAAGSTPGNSNPPNAFTLALTPQTASLPSNTLGYPIFSGSPFLTQLNIRVTFSNGQLAPDGTVVNLTTDNVAVAFITVLDDPATTDINEFTVATGTNNSQTSGGQAVFFINSGAEGTAHFTASATTENRTYSGTLTFNVTAGPSPTVQQLSAVLPRTNLPVNNLNIPFFNGTPFMMEADLQFKDVFGNFTNPDVNTDGISVINVTITPANVLYFTTLDDSTTTDINEFIAPEQTSGSIQMNSGHGNLFLWSRNIPGSATVTLSATEAGSGRVLTSSFNIQVIDDGSNPGQPSSMALNNNGGALYINGSGGVTSRGINVTVNSGNVPVLDPQVNNVKLSLITDASNSGEKLSGTNVSGASVQGTSINIATVNGIANALVSSGSNTNTITVTVTVDRADNNVDNGIQDGLSSPTTYVVSDGVLWALQLTSPALDALTVNGPSSNSGSGVTFDFQDGTYSLVFSAIATDKGGNPALPQTLQFGMINSPITGYPDNGSGTFVISGADGDPQEGGSRFTSTSGAFLTAAGGAQPGDTLVVFGEESLGNEDLESAVTVSSINSQTSLNINEKFNRNDATGVINNDGGVLPYAIGRAVDGNINATAIINDVGVATTNINYPVARLGRIAAIFVKGQGAINNGLAKSVTDVQLIAFPGIEGFNGQNSTLTVSPNKIPGNISTGFVVCLADSARNPLPGRYISFSYAGGNGQGFIDGVPGSGVMVNPTGTNGCASGIATTTGVIPGSTDTGFNFFSGSLTCDLTTGSSNTNCLDVIASANGVLNANPSSFIGRGALNITLTLFDGSGQPIQGASISGSCDQITGGSLGIISGPSVTNGSGQSFVTVSVALDAPMGGLSGACTFATASGSPTVNVNFSGGDSCVLVAPSPLPPAGICP